MNYATEQTELFVERLYYPSGQLRAEVNRLHGKLHGLSQFFSEAGVLLSTAWFYEGVAEGKMIYYYPSGNLFSVQQFKKGIRIGLQESYYENGAPKSLIPYDDEGRLHGTVQLFAPDGTLKRSCTYTQGVPHE